MSDCEKIILSLVSSLILFSLGILYKTFEIKYSKLLEIRENETFCKSWIKIITDSFEQYKTQLLQYSNYIEDYLNAESNFPIFDFQEDKIPKISTDKLFNYYITNRKKNGNEYAFFKFIKSLELITYYNSILQQMFNENKKNSELFLTNTNDLITEFEEERINIIEPELSEFRNEYLKIVNNGNQHFWELIRTSLYSLLLNEYNIKPDNPKITSLYNKLWKIRSKIIIQKTSRKKYSLVLKQIIEDMNSDITELNSSFTTLINNDKKCIVNIK